MAASHSAELGSVPSPEVVFSGWDFHVGIAMGTPERAIDASTPHAGIPGHLAEEPWGFTPWLPSDGKSGNGSLVGIQPRPFCPWYPSFHLLPDG